MLTDIFARRYNDVILWHTHAETDRQFLVQSFGILIQQLYPYYRDGKAIESAKAVWASLHNRLAHELGLPELSPKMWGYWVPSKDGQRWQAGFYTFDTVCQTFILAKFDGSVAADRFMKERMSFIELAFREKEKEVSQDNANLPHALLAAEREETNKSLGGLFLPGNRAEAIKYMNDHKSQTFRTAVAELNIRMQQAGYNLHYHNGFIQRSSDSFIEKQVAQPFWALVSGPLWVNVDTDMKEAIDRRDNNGRDPAFYAAKSLESVIKIISAQKGWTHGKETGASNFIDNLHSKKNGHFIVSWEADMLKAFFKSVRNPFGHGPGLGDMPVLSPQQTDWTIEFCMTWIKSLIRRM